ncbi:hypothetical protein HZH68_012733 [Vespula germanica]|uniref:Uncharacterized protein n=1 Tax=Vespula germanica TaxID=30212 RepID=A0A834JG36_VESGE|nr:hypothetical protein HZH68_012733 [Vespula germanica]
MGVGRWGGDVGDIECSRCASYRSKSTDKKPLILHRPPLSQRRLSRSYKRNIFHDRKRIQQEWVIRVVWFRLMVQRDPKLQESSKKILENTLRNSE